MKTIFKSLLALAVTALLSAAAFATEQQSAVDESQFFGNFRLGYIAAEDDAGDSVDSSAFGGKLGYTSNGWHGLTAGGTLYATQKLFNDDNSDFFSSDGESYALLGEAFVQGRFGHTVMKAGRFEFDSPYVDTDDIRMMPNTFSGAVFVNTDISGITLYAAYLDEWSGVDSETPEDFTELNGDDGLFAAGAVFEGIENLALQAWYYHGSDFASLLYVEAMYEIGDVVIGAQFGSQSDDTADNSSPDGDVYGVMASYTLNDFTVSAAYNYVSGTITNGFGGGPFFTSAADHTIGDALDQNAMAAGIDYSGIDKLTLSVLHVAFDKGADETDVTAAYEFSDEMNIEAIYHHMHEDGDMLLVRFNVGF